MIQLKPDSGIPRHILLLMSVLGAFAVANLYYNQALLELISRGLGISHVQANLITVITQVGYALGLLFVIPMADMVSVRRIIISAFIMSAVAALVIATADGVWMLWGGSLVLGL